MKIQSSGKGLKVSGSEFVFGPFEGANTGSEGPGEPIAEVGVDLLWSLHVRAVGSWNGLGGI